jgi:hypothetical protein
VTQGWCHFDALRPDPALQGTLFGWTVDVLGDTLVVGSLAGDLVSVYERTGSTWSLVQVLDDPNPGDNQFGANLALSEDFLAVGAHLDDTAGANAGAVHVFRRENGSMVFDATLTSTTPAVGGHYGRALDVDGIWLAVGAPGEASGGRVHVHMRTFAWWFELTGLGTATSGALGSSVVVNQIPGQTAAQIVAGDPGCDVGGVDAGRVSILHVRPFAYVHEMLQAPVPTAGDQFGYAVEFDGTTLVVSSIDTELGGIEVGAVDVFVGLPYEPNPEFDHVQRLTPCSDGAPLPGPSVGFGFALALDGGRLAVGAPGRDEGGTVGGAVEVFRPDPFGSGFARDGLVFASGAGPDDEFGWSVALSGETLVASAWGDDGVGQNHGAVYPVSLASKSVPGGACPCDCLARVEHYGVGKPGTNGVPTIEALSHPVPGETTTVRVANAFVGATPVVVWGLVPTSVVFEGLTFLVEDVHLVTLPTIGITGQVGVSWKVPAAPQSCGLVVHAQAFMFDPGAGGPFSLAHTDGLRLVVGY